MKATSRLMCNYFAATSEGNNIFDIQVFIKFKYRRSKDFKLNRRLFERLRWSRMSVSFSLPSPTV